MQKLRTALAAALLVASVVSLDANAVVSRPAADQVQPQRNLTPICYMYFMGQWIAYNC